MEHLQEQLAKIEQDLSAEKQKGPEGDQTIIARLESEQAHILEQIMLANQAKEQQEREVHTQEVNESNSDIAISVFDALIPDAKVFESMMGLTEFSDWRTGFYQLFDGALADRTQLMNDKHAYELAQKDEKIRLLSGQGLELQRYLDEARRKAEDAFKEIDDIEAKYNELQDNYDATIERFNQANELTAQLRQDNIAQLNELTVLQNKIDKLEAAQTPKEESKPSQSFTDRMNEIKTKNSTSADEMILRFNARQKSDEAKIQVPDLPSAVLPFQGEDGANPATDAGNTQLPSAQVDATVNQEATFPSAPNVGTVHPPDLATGDIRGQQVYSEVAEGQGVSREEHEALKSRVEALEGKVA